MLNEVKRREELADFLRARRERLMPADMGLPTGTHRRTSGLRREEVALLAGISQVWYTWLEQARNVRPSLQVVASLASALRLDPNERDYLLTLAQPERQSALPPAEVVGPELQRVLDSLDTSSAFITGRRTDVLAWNEAADAIHDLSSAPPGERIGIWRMFAHPAARRLGLDWGHQAPLWLSDFRAGAACYLGDPSFTELIEKLKQVSLEFRTWWPHHEVRGRPGGRRKFQHPSAGLLVLEHMTFHPQQNPELKLHVYTPLPEAGSVAKVRALIEQRHQERFVGPLPRSATR